MEYIQEEEWVHTQEEKLKRIQEEKLEHIKTLAFYNFEPLLAWLKESVELLDKISDSFKVGEEVKMNDKIALLYAIYKVRDFSNRVSNINDSLKEEFPECKNVAEERIGSFLNSVLGKADDDEKICVTI